MNNTSTYLFLGAIQLKNVSDVQIFPTQRLQESVVSVINVILIYFFCIPVYHTDLTV